MGLAASESAPAKLFVLFVASFVVVAATVAAGVAPPVGPLTEQQRQALGALETVNFRVRGGARSHAGAGAAARRRYGDPVIARTLRSR